MIGRARRPIFRDDVEMRVALTGAQGTGKSTLALELSTALSVPILPTPGRAMAERGLPINQESSVTSQTIAWMLQPLQYEERIDSLGRCSSR